MRIPLSVRYPAKFPKGKLIDKIVLNPDDAPSILDLAGIKSRASSQGKDWVPLIEDNAKNWRTSFLHEYFYENGYAVPTIEAVRTETLKLVQYPGEKGWSEVYDLIKDPNEKINFYNTSDGSKLKAQLGKELEKQEKSLVILIRNFLIPNQWMKMENTNC